jgi:segregation and condensation protein A
VNPQGTSAADAVADDREPGQPTLFPLPPADDDWSSPVRGPGEAASVEGEPVLVVDVSGFEGPLDLLLALARSQKVDLARISILALADQYLAFIDAVRSTRLELAADYLVMAAWLAYLKSRLLLPSPAADDEPSGEELAAALAFRLRRLEAIRAAAGRLVNRNRLGRDVFARGAPEPIALVRQETYTATLYDILSAYAALRQRQMATPVRVARRGVWALADAREILERLIGRVGDWTPIQTFLARYMTPEMRATVIASSFTASLELVKEGRLEMRQTGPFAPLYIRARRDGRPEGSGGDGDE